MKSDETIVTEIKNIEACITVACHMIRQYNEKTRDYLADFIASLCDVNKHEMFTDTECLSNSHARWFFWYSYRYMTKESYRAIAQKCGQARMFTESCVGICVGKMSMMIEQEAIWKKRWVMTKRIIKAINSTDEDECTKDITLKVKPPRGVNVKMQIIND